MATFPSSLPYAAFLQYSPHGTSPFSKRSKDVTRAIKGDGFIRGHRVIDYAARRIGEERENAEIRCFAIVRTMSGVEVDLIMSPVEGMISFDGTIPQRRP